jgi:putative selenate reductase
MDAVGAVNVGDFVIRAHGRGVEALERAGVEPGLVHDISETAVDLRAIVGDATYERWVGEAALLNTETYVAQLRDDPRYRHAANATPPKKIGSVLELFDCVTCDKCIPVCPNDANFALEIPPQTLPIVKVRQAGGTWTVVETGELVLTKKHQIANFADFCNECGNCDVFCPEDGGPYVLKPRFFGSLESYRKLAGYDGFYLEQNDRVQSVYARFAGRDLVLTVQGSQAGFAGPGFAVQFDRGSVLATLSGKADDVLDLTHYYIMDMIRTSALEPGVVNYLDMGSAT